MERDRERRPALVGNLLNSCFSSTNWICYKTNKITIIWFKLIWYETNIKSAQKNKQTQKQKDFIRQKKMQWHCFKYFVRWYCCFTKTEWSQMGLFFLSHYNSFIASKLLFSVAKNRCLSRLWKFGFGCPNPTYTASEQPHSTALLWKMYVCCIN